MRKLTFIQTPVDDKRKFILHKTEDGTYLYAYDCVQDTSCVSDLFFTTLAEAEDYCEDTFGVDSDDWIVLPETLDGCQDDFILPTRVKGRVIGKPLWGQYEILENWKWVERYPDCKAGLERYLKGQRRLINQRPKEF